jgi:Flp pilus assembly protein CpaB
MALGSPRLSTRTWPAPRIDARLLVGLLLVATALAGGVMFAGQLRITEPVVVAARTIPAGAVISASDLRVSEARLEGELGTLAIAETELGSIVGRTAAQTIHAGTLVLRADLGSGPVLGAGEVAVTVAVASDSVFGQLRRGDAVTVLATTDPGREQSATSVLLERAMVYHVATDVSRVSLGGSGGTDADGRISNVTLVVPRSEMERVAHALVNGRLTLALAPREAP